MRSSLLMVNDSGVAQELTDNNSSLLYLFASQLGLESIPGVTSHRYVIRSPPSSETAEISPAQSSITFHRPRHFHDAKKVSISLLLFCRIERLFYLIIHLSSLAYRNLLDLSNFANRLLTFLHRTGPEPHATCSLRGFRELYVLSSSHLCLTYSRIASPSYWDFFADVGPYTCSFFVCEMAVDWRRGEGEGTSHRYRFGYIKSCASTMSSPR